MRGHGPRLTPKRRPYSPFLVGLRTPEDARAFMFDVADRIANHTQLTTDGLESYPEAIRNAFGNMPLFVSSDMTYPIQAADLCIYCVNWGFRVPGSGMVAPARREIADEFGEALGRLQFCGDGFRDGKVFKAYGVVFVPDPYTPR